MAWATNATGATGATDATDATTAKVNVGYMMKLGCWIAFTKTYIESAS